MSKIFSSFLISLFLCACASLDMDSGKLSESEQLTIIDMARYTLTQSNRKLITDVEAVRINKEMPEVKIHYTGHRQGRMIMSWPLKKKTINLVYSGEFLSDSAMWKLGITKHDYRISKKRVNPYNKVKSAEEKDFDDLRRKKKVRSKK